MNTTIARELPADDAWSVLRDYGFVQQRYGLPGGNPMWYTFCVDLLDALPEAEHPVQELSLHSFRRSFIKRWGMIDFSNNANLSREDWSLIETVQRACSAHSEAIRSGHL